MDSAFLTLIRWIVIYPVDSAIQLSNNNWNQKVRRSTAEAYNPEASKFPLSVYNHARVFLADAAVQSEIRKNILPKYGIREFKL